MSRTLTQPVGTLRSGTASTVATILVGVAHQRLQAVPIHAPNHDLRLLDQQLCDIVHNLLFATTGRLHEQIVAVFAKTGIVELAARFHKTKGFDQKSLRKALERFVECGGELVNDEISLPPSRPTIFLVRRSDLCEAHLSTQAQEEVVDAEQERQEHDSLNLSALQLQDALRAGDYSPEELAVLRRIIDDRLSSEAKEPAEDLDVEFSYGQSPAGQTQSSPDEGLLPGQREELCRRFNQLTSGAIIEKLRDQGMGLLEIGRAMGKSGSYISQLSHQKFQPTEDAVRSLRELAIEKKILE